MILKQPGGKSCLIICGIVIFSAAKKFAYDMSYEFISRDSDQPV